MKTSQFATKLQKYAMAAILSVGHYAFAANDLKVRQLPNDFQVRLKQIYADKNRPFPQISTKTPASPGPRARKQSVKMGGVSDGGGNAVGTTLFDFYENHGSLEISVDELIWLEPKTQLLLTYLNNQVPAVRDADSGGFGDVLVKSLQDKKVYLESKVLSSDACKNQSLVSSPDQVVVACQSDAELRISVEWMQSTDANNRVGLLTHELILAWARNRFNANGKANLEQKVRELNRHIFNSYSGSTDISQAIMKVFGEVAYNPQRYSLLKRLPEKVLQATSTFCANPGVDISAQFDSYKSDEILKAQLPESLKAMQSFAATAQAGQQAESDSEVVWAICQDYIVDSTPVRAPDMNLLPDQCVSNLNNSLELMSRYFGGSVEGLSGAEKKWFFTSSFSSLKSAALLCSGLRGIELEKRPFIAEEKGHRMMRETYVEALVYSRWKLAQNEWQISFMQGNMKKQSNGKH